MYIDVIVLRKSMLLN